MPMLLMDWNSGGARGYVLGDEAGHPASVVCSSGYGSYEAGAAYIVEEVVFCPGTQRTVRDNCGERTYQELAALLEKRNVPKGMYHLPLGQRFSGVLPDWRIVHEEPAEGGRRLLM